ncbi:hypothetical protein BH10BAC4_BH10BAC4_25430 [soil metagenome]
MKFRLVLLFLIFSAAAVAELYAQESPKPTDKKFPTTLQPVNPVRYYGPRKEKKSKKKKGAITHDAQNEYYKRIENTWREREKREKSYERGEALDYMKPPYFGHKKPPKIRAIEKRKYCKICGIRH